MNEQPSKDDLIRLLAKSHHYNLIDNIIYIYNWNNVCFTYRNDFDFDELRRESNRLKFREESDLRTFAKILKKYV